MEKTYMDVEDLEVYQKLCKLHIEVCDLSHEWPQEERYELGSQVRRSSNSSPAQLAEKHDDRHIRNKIEGVNRSRGEAGETIHHLFIANVVNHERSRSNNNERPYKLTDYWHKCFPGSIVCAVI